MTLRSLRILIAVLLMLMVCFTAVPVLAEEVPTLTLFIEEVATIEDLETNAATLWLEEQVGCNLEFIIAPTGSAEEKMNILLNSGDYPDIFYRSVPNENLYGIEAGILLDLTEYINDPELMPNFNYIMKIRPNLLSQCKAVDGKIYSLPDYAETLHVQYGNKMFCNKALLEELGKEIPTTIDEMYEAMVAFKAAHPEGVAYAACTVENSAPWGFLTNAWTYSTFNTGDAGELGLRDHNGTVESILDDEEYRAALRFLNKLYTEELLYEGSFTMDGNQMKALLASETPVLFWSGMHNVNFVDGAATPELYANQKPVAPLRGPDGAQYVTFFPSVPTAGFAISKTCENVELAIKLADIHYSQIGFWTVNEGREGIEWVWAEEGQVGVSGAPAIANRTGAYISGLQNVKWEPNALRAQIDEICTSWFDEANYDETDPADGMFFRPKMTAELYVPYYQDEYQTIPDPKFNSEEEEELSMISVSLENYVAESRVAFITGAMSLDNDWDAYVSSLKNMGIDTVIDLYQTARDRTK